MFLRAGPGNVNMSNIVAYIVSLIVFGVLDAIWLWSMSARLYRPVLGDILLDDLRIAPALVFYFLYPVGLTIFATSPALRAGEWTSALVYGALFGAFAYATYDLTNYATIRNWNWQITVIDILYGATVAALASLAGYWATKTILSGDTL